MVGDHSPILTVFYKLIYRNFKNAYFIFLLRDPIDAAYSYSSIKKNPASNPVYFTWKWNNSIKAYNWIRKQTHAKTLLVRYEDLVTAPNDISKDILSFLNLDFEDVIHSNETESAKDLMGTSKLEFHKNLYKPISDKSVGKGHQHLPLESKKIVSKKTRKWANKFGYNKE